MLCSKCGTNRLEQTQKAAESTEEPAELTKEQIRARRLVLVVGIVGFVFGNALFLIGYTNENFRPYFEQYYDLKSLLFSALGIVVFVGVFRKTAIRKPRRTTYILMPFLAVQIIGFVTVSIMILSW